MAIFLGAGYAGIRYYYGLNKKPENSPDYNKKEEQNNISNNKEQENKNQSIETKKIEYKILNLNKKDGDIFSVPDEVIFSISPSVDKSKITLTDDEGIVLYTEEKNSSEAKFIVYPNKKIKEGTSGTLLIEGYVGDDVVVYKKIKIVF